MPALANRYPVIGEPSSTTGTPSGLEPYADQQPSRQVRRAAVLIWRGKHTNDQISAATGVPAALVDLMRTEPPKRV